MLSSRCQSNVSTCSAKANLPATDCRQHIPNKSSAPCSLLARRVSSATVTWVSNCTWALPRIAQHWCSRATGACATSGGAAPECAPGGGGEGGGQGGRRTEPREPAGHLVRSWHFPHLSVNLPRAECPLTFQGLKKKKQKITLQNSGNCQNSATTLSIPELKQNVGFREPRS